MNSVDFETEYEEKFVAPVPGGEYDSTTEYDRILRVTLVLRESERAEKEAFNPYDEPIVPNIGDEAYTIVNERQVIVLAQENNLLVIYDLRESEGADPALVKGIARAHLRSL